MIQRAMKLVVCITICVMASPVFAQNPVNSIHDVVVAERVLSAGRRLSAAIDLSQCTPDTPTTPASTVRGGLNIEAYNIMPDSSLSFSDNHFTVRSDGSPIIQFLRYTVDKAGAVRFTSHIFSMPTYALQSQYSYTCKLGEGLKLLLQ
jgi:hypothetical protein